jgi:hypothetical protein
MLAEGNMIATRKTILSIRSGVYSESDAKLAAIKIESYDMDTFEADDAHLADLTAKLDINKALRVTAKKLSKRYLQIFIDYYGLDGTGIKTMFEVGQRHRLTPTRIQQIVSRVRDLIVKERDNLLSGYALKAAHRVTSKPTPIKKDKKHNIPALPKLFADDYPFSRIMVPTEGLT